MSRLRQFLNATTGKKQSGDLVSLGKVSKETRGGAGFALDWKDTRYNGMPLV